MRRVAAACLLVLVAGCGGRGFAPEAASDLRRRVGAVHQAVAAGDAEAVAQALVPVRMAVLRWQGTGDLEKERAIRILAAAAAVESALGELEPATAPQPDPEPSVHDEQPEPRSDDEDKDEDEDEYEYEGDDDDGKGKDKKGKGHGRGKGHKD